MCSGGKDLTEKLLPAVAKLAQDGALEARIYAKMNLKVSVYPLANGYLTIK